MIRHATRVVVCIAVGLMSLIGSARVLAQSPPPVWNPQQLAQDLAQGSYVTGTSPVFVVENGIIYSAGYDPEDPNQTTEGEQVGEYVEAYNYAVTWHAGQSTVWFEEDPENSPTGEHVEIELHVRAVAYYVQGDSFDSYVVGLQLDYSWSSGQEASTLSFFAPAAYAADDTEAEHLADCLANAKQADAHGVTEENVSCLDACQTTYESAIATAVITHDGCVDACDAAVWNGGAAGCLGGATICTAIPGLQPFIGGCCIIGGLVGGAVWYANCIFTCNNAMQTSMRLAENAYRECVEGCGYYVY